MHTQHRPFLTEARFIMRTQHHWLLLLLLTFSLFFVLFLASAQADGAQVTGTVWLDRDTDGKMDSTEKPLPDAKVYLEQKTDDGVKELASKRVKNDGQFAFSVSKAGDYRLRIELPSGYYFSVAGKDSAALPAQKGKSYTPYFSVESGDAFVKNIGVCSTASNLSMIAFEDSNANGGRANNEPLLRGVTAELLYENAGKTYVIAKSTSDKNGNLSIWEISPGTYKVRVTLPDHYAIGPKGEKTTNWYNCINADQTNGKGTSNAFTVEAGHTASLGIGAVKTGSLKGTLWLDANSNGKKDSGEKGLTGATLTLTSVALQIKRTAKPNASGEYSFTGLQPGNYKLSVQLPSGYIFTYPGTSALSSISSSGELAANVQVEKTVTMNPIGAMPAASLSLTLYVDGNENGKLDSGETLLSGASVTAVQNGDKVATVKTNQKGVANFATLRSGSVTLECDLPSGYIFLPVSGGLFDSGKVSASGSASLKLSGKSTAVSAAVTVPAAISGKLFEDPQNSGLYSDDCDLLAGFTVQAVNAQGKTVATATTDRAGAYTLYPLPSGAYTVHFLLNDPYVASPHTKDNAIVNQTPAYGETAVLNLTAGQRVGSVDAAVFRAGIIDGTVKNALDDGGIKGITATLMNQDGTPVSDFSYGVTNQNGKFTIKGVLPGTYFVRYTIPESAALTDPATDEKQLDSSSFTVKSGAQKHMDALTAVYTGSIAGFIGEKDSASSVGAQITLTGKETGVKMQAETVNGNYSFSGLRPDTYTMKITLPEGYVFGQLSGSPFGPEAKQTDSASVKLSPEEKKTVNVLAAKPVTFSGQVFYDADASGKQDAKEAAAASRSMTLWLGSKKAADIETGSDGAFSVSGLVPGTYTLRMKLESNEVISVLDGETKDQEWSASVSLNRSASLSIPLVQYASVAGSVWCLDGSTDGVKDISVTLLDSNGKTVGTKKTNAKGAFSFTKLLPGKYSLKAKLPSGYLFARKQDTESRKSFIQSQADGTGKSVVFTVPMGKKLTGIDIGMGAMGRIGDKAWLDENGNGMQDINEPGVPGIKIELYQHGELVASATTDSYGRYDLTNLYPGEYDMKVTMHKELKTTKKQTKFPLVASVLPESSKTTVTAKIVVPSAGENLHVDLGFQLRKKGVYPAAMKNLPSKNWKPYSER